MSIYFHKQQINTPDQIKNITLEVFEKKIDNSINETSLVDKSLYDKKNENVIINSSSDNIINSFAFRKNLNLTIFNKYNNEDCDEDEELEYIEDDVKDKVEKCEDDDEDEECEDENDEQEDDESIVELFNIKIKGREKEYYTDNIENGSIYEIDEKESIGPKVGKFVNGKAVMNRIK